MACVALGIVYIVLVAPLRDLYSERALRVETRTSLLAKLNTAAGELPALRARVTELGAAAGSDRLTLKGTTGAIASAALQSYIQELAAGGDITIRSIESLPAEGQGRYRRLGLRLFISGAYESLIDLLAKIENATPPLVVDNLQIRSVLRRPGATPILALDANFEVYGFYTEEAGVVVKPEPRR